MSNRFHGNTPEAGARMMAERMAPPGFTFTRLYPYRFADGAFAFGQVRCDHPTEGKWLRPMKPNGSSTSFTVGGIPTPRPLYRLPELLAADPAAPVYVVEGEKAADALAALGHVVTTSGSATSADGADWSPLKGRQVIVWPDNDEPGNDYAAQVAAKARAVGARCEFLDASALNLPPAGDCFDWLQANPGATAAEVLALPRMLPVTTVETPAADNGWRLDLRRGDTIKSRKVEWCWDGYLPLGKLVVFCGPPGCGKTTITHSMGATITRGGRWPDGSKALRGDVVYWSGEDDAEDTITPRLKAAGADMSRVHLVGDARAEDGETAAFDPAHDIDLLRAALKAIPSPVRLLVIDPIVSAISGDGHKSNDVRRGLQPLVDLAAELRCAIIGITHFSKGTAGRDPVERVTGSIAFGALARLVMVATKQPEEGERPARRVLMRAKSNIGPDGGGFVYDVEMRELQDDPGHFASVVVWGEPVEGSARDILAEAEAEGGRGEEEETREWLRSELQDGGKPQQHIRKEANAAGFAWRTVERAKAALGIKSSKTGFDGGWVWNFPKTAKNPEDRQEIEPQKLGGLGGLGDVRTPADDSGAEAFEV